MAFDGTSPTTIKIFSLNCWGLKFIAKHRHERLLEIGRQISTLSPAPEIVGLQECWTQQDYLSIRDQTCRLLPYGKFYHSGIFGGGLAILSKWPIVESSMVRYSLNGRPTAFWRGDWYVGKGVACASIRAGPASSDIIDVFCTHLHAPYEREPNDSYICHRTAQAWEIAKLMRSAAQKGHIVIGLGDFNMIPLSLAHRLITTYAPVRDVWREIHPDSSVGAAVDSVERSRGRPLPTAEFNIFENGTTCDSVLNTWRWNKRKQHRLDNGEDVDVPCHTMDPRAKRLDYIFVGHPISRSFDYWDVTAVNVGMLDRHPVLKCSLSDHFSVEATITRRSSLPGTTVPLDSSSLPATTASQSFLDGPRVPSAEPLPLAFLNEILAMISTYTLRELRQRRLRLYHFLGSLGISIGCFIGVFWSPHNFVAFLLLFLSTFNLAAGVVNGLIGGLFVGSELRALKEFEWEIKNERRKVRKSESSNEPSVVQREEAVRDWYD